MKRKNLTIFGFALVFISFFILNFHKLEKLQVKKDEDFINRVIKPAIIFVKDFHEKNGYYPTENDFYSNNLECKGRVDIIKAGETFKDENYDEFKKEIVIPKGEYIIWIWRREWAELYYSHTNKIYSNKGVQTY